MAEDVGGGGGHGGLRGASEHKLLAVAVGFGEAARAVDDDALCFVHVDGVTDSFVADKIGVRKSVKEAVGSVHNLAQKDGHYGFRAL